MQNKAQRKFLAAISFAARKHAGQLRKNGITPYIAHPLRVAFLVRDLFGVSSVKALSTAVLHDTLEDTGTDFDELSECFDPETAEWVAMLSKDKRLPRREREARYAKALRQAPLLVQVIKLADLCDNFLDFGGARKKARAKVLAKMNFVFGALKKAKKRELAGYLKIAQRFLSDAI